MSQNADLVDFILLKNAFFFVYSLMNGNDKLCIFFFVFIFLLNLHTHTYQLLFFFIHFK